MVIHFVFRVLELCCDHVGQVRCKHRPRRRFLSGESILIFFGAQIALPSWSMATLPPSLRVSTIPGFGDEHGIKLDWMKQLDTKAVSSQTPPCTALPRVAPVQGGLRIPEVLSQRNRNAGVPFCKPGNAGTGARRSISRGGAAGESRAPHPPPRWEMAAPGVVLGARLAHGCFLIIIFFSAFFVQVAKKQCYS